MYVPCASVQLNRINSHVLYQTKRAMINSNQKHMIQLNVAMFLLDQCSSVFL